MKDKLNSSIRISLENRIKLRRLGKKGDSYDDIVSDLIDFEKEYKEYLLNAKGRRISGAFSFMRMLRYKYRIYCAVCERYKATEIHHINKNTEDNSFTNLVLVCKKCHQHIHKPYSKTEERIKPILAKYRV